MIFKVKNLGIIEEAEVDLGKDLILLTGHNNRGKTYLAYTIYGLYSNNINLNSIFSIHDKQIKTIIESKYEINKMSFDIKIKDILRVYKDSVQKQFLNIPLLDLFATTNNSLNNAEFILDYTTYHKKRWRIEEPHYFGMFPDSDEFKGLEVFIQGGCFKINIPKTKKRDKIIYEILHRIRVISSIIFFYTSTYIAPAERSAINIFSKELALVKNRSLNAILKANGNNNEMLDLLKSRVNRYPKPIRDNLEIAEDLANLSKNISVYAYLAEELERDLLKGKIVISEHGQAEYLPDNEEPLNLELHLTGSIVKSLANIVFYLRHLAKPHDTIIIDEPELNLHPDNQRLIARFLGRLVNEGFKVIVSTHSDYIVRELNNMIMLSQEHENRDALLEKYGYQKNQLVKPKQVEALLFTKDSRKPTKIEVDESGLTVKTIDEVIEQMNISAEDIYFQLFEKVG